MYARRSEPACCDSTKASAYLQTCVYGGHISALLCKGTTCVHGGHISAQLCKGTSFASKYVVAVCSGGVSSTDVPFGPADGGALQRYNFLRLNVYMACTALQRHQLTCKRVYMTGTSHHNWNHALQPRGSAGRGSALSALRTGSGRTTCLHVRAYLPSF